MKLKQVSRVMNMDEGYGFSALYQLFTLLYASFLHSTVFLGERSIEDSLTVADILSLSCVSHSMNRYFECFLYTYLRDEFDGRRFLSGAKCVLALQAPGVSDQHRKKLQSYLLEKNPNWSRYVLPLGKKSPTMQSFWLRSYHFSTGYDREASSSLDIWVIRHGYQRYWKWITGEPEFQILVVSPNVQLNSMAIVVATLNRFSPYTFDLIRRRVGSKCDSYAYQDLVAALSIPWYDPEILYEILEPYPIFTDEMIWNVISREPCDSNDKLTLMILGKNYVKDVAWTFQSRSNVPLTQTNNSVTDIRSTPKFKELLLRQAKAQGYSKKIIKLLRKRVE